MCGIGGVIRTRPDATVPEAALRRMARALRHRGPDGYGIARLPGAGLVSTRLAIIDLDHGWQPWVEGHVVVFNGELFNHVELRAELERDGVRFTTRCDTEVVARALERFGVAACDRFNGQFAIGWWDPGARRLTLIRDRFGILPLHWAPLPDGGIAFASEAKGLFASGEVTAAPDLAGLDEVFTFWSALAPATPFKGVRQVPPGHLLTWQDGRVADARAWWEPAGVPAGGAPDTDVEPLLRDAVELRLRADVPVGTYLSGGLDSSVLTALAQEASDHPLRSFSVAFSDARYDERAQQELVAARLGTTHHVLEIAGEEIATALPGVVRHAETPLVRTAPAPLSLLARETRAQGITVIATGEGADELYWGYDVFKEVRLRLLLASDPAAPEAGPLLDALYPHLGAAGRRGPAWRRFFADAGPVDDPLFSHQTRFAATAFVKAFYSEDARGALVDAGDPRERLRSTLPAAMSRWSPLERAAHLEIRTLLSGYLLAAQGDRVAMAHGVECRYPFLDHRVFEHSLRLLARAKYDGGADKVALRALAARLLPPSIARRAKQPYRAPEVSPFFDGSPPDWVRERLTATALAEAGIFDPVKAGALVRRCLDGRARGAREGMAVVGILSTQLWHDSFFGGGRDSWEPETAEPKVKIEQLSACT